uniref:ribonuclease H n=1 Tax=Anolis carolinensis TaxID=28377 RepID=A0A803TV24_ANOCA
MEDIFEANLIKQKPTYFSQSHKSFSWIDYILIKNTNRSRILNMETQPIWISDHAPIIVELRIEEPDETEAIKTWRYKHFIIKTEKLKNELSEEIKNYFKENRGSASTETVWDTAKAVIRGYCIAKEVAVKKQQDRERKRVFREIEETQKLLQNKYQVQVKAKLENLKKQLEEIDNLDLWKKDIFIKNNFQRQNTNTTKKLANYLKNMKEKGRVIQLKNKYNKKVNSTKEIREAFVDFYQELYKKQIHGEFEEKIQKIIDREDNRKLGTEISYQEIEQVIDTLKNRKSPGGDGYTAEFYKEMKEIIIPELKILFNNIMKGGKIPDTWRESEIITVRKSGKDPEDPNSYRPISLLNQDYKIFTKILVNRIEEIISKIVKEDQYGFIKGRNIAHPIRNVLNILNHNKKRKFALLKLDIYKAFDSLNHKYLLQLMGNYGFDISFIKIVKELYSNSRARIRVNEGLTKYFKTERGVKQGCPLSPLLFALAMEPLADRIRNNGRIKGYQIRNEEVKINLYADDILLIMENPAEAIHEIQIILKDFERYSGLKVNMSKSEMMIYNLGKKEQKELQTKMGDIKIIRNKIKYLGITITKEITKLKAANYGAIWKKIQEKLKAWGDKQLSIPRKILALKMCIIPKLLYLFQTLSIKIDYRQIKEWDNTLREWIYGKKRNRIMKKIQYTPRRLLGWGFPNLQNYYEAFQLRSLLEISLKGEDKWIKVENEINEGRGKYGLYTRDIKEIKEKLTGPRKIEFECWQKWQKLWANKISGKTPIKSMGLPERLVNTLEEKGLRRVKDMWKQDGGIINWLDLLEKGGKEYWLKLRGIWEKVKKEGAQPTEELKVDKLLNAREKTSKGTVAKIYNLMVEDKEFMIRAIRNKWNGVKILSTQEVDEIIRNINKIKTEKYNELEKKMVLRWYRTPEQLSYMIKGKNSKCWHCNKEKGTYSHMWWECSELKKFWLMIQGKIQDLLQITIQINNDLLLWGVLDHPSIKTECQELLKVTIRAAHAVIARGWRDKSKWTLNNWNDYLYDQVLLDITGIMTNQVTRMNKQKDITNRWKDYFNWVKNGGANDYIKEKIQRLYLWLDLQD